MATRHRHQDGGFAMVALLVGISIMAVALSVALPSWSTAAQRERETELIFRGQQYARAIALYQRKYANAFPPSLDILVEQRFLRRKFPDPMAKDGEFQVLLAGQTILPQSAQGTATGPGGAGGTGGTGLPDGRTGTGVIPQAGRGGAAPTPQVQSALQSGLPSGARGGIIGVVSKSQATSLRIWNGRTKYNEWAFVATQATTAAGAPTGSQNPTGGVGGRTGGPGGGPGGGIGGGAAGRGQPPQPSGQNRGPGSGGDQPIRQAPFGQPRTGGGVGGR